MAKDRNKNKRFIASENIPLFETAVDKLESFHKELEKLSNKKPDGSLNPFKLGFINQVLDTLNKIIGDDYRPFPDFLIFDIEGSLPSTSDAVMMLSQYKTALIKFRFDHSIRDYHGHFERWNTKEFLENEDTEKNEDEIDEDEDEQELEFDEDEDDE